MIHSQHPSPPVVVEVSVYREKSTNAGSELCEKNWIRARGLRNDERYVEGDGRQWLPKLLWSREALEKPPWDWGTPAVSVAPVPHAALCLMQGRSLGFRTHAESQAHET